MDSERKFVCQREKGYNKHGRLDMSGRVCDPGQSLGPKKYKAIGDEGSLGG